MPKKIDLPTINPVFPLPKAVLLPRSRLPLHIFEPRYKIMVRDHIEEDKPFGIILNENNVVCTKGCRVKVQKVYKKYSNGEYDILVKGVEQFKVINTRMEGETVIGEINYVPLDSDGDEQLCKNIQELYLQVLIKVGISNSLEMHMGKKLSYEFLQGFELPLIVKKKLILMNSENNKKVNLESLVNQEIKNCISLFTDKRMEITVNDLTVYDEFPTYSAVITDTLGNATLGWGTNSNSEVAFLRALLEANQARTIQISGAREDMHKFDYLLLHDQRQPYMHLLNEQRLILLSFLRLIIYMVQLLI